jgi:hypothetical protein
MNLWLSIECGAGIEQADDTATLGGRPDWELDVVAATLSEPELVAGFHAELPKGYDERYDGWLTNFYFCEHAGTEANSITVLDREGDRLLLRITGETIDVNYYDDSKPRSTLLVETWFERDPRGQRSMS